MNSFRKVRLLDAEELSRAIEKRIKEYNPTLHILGQLQLQLDSVLNNQNLSADEKLAMFKGLQNKFTNLKNRSPNFQDLAPKNIAAEAGVATAPEIPIPFPPIPVHAPTPAAHRGPDDSIEELERTLDLTDVSMRDVSMKPVDQFLFPQSTKTLEEKPEQELLAGLSSPDSAISKFRIKAGLSKKYQEKSNKLLDLLKEHSNKVNVNPGTDEMLVEGELVRGSNLQDLIKNLYRTAQYRNTKGETAFRDQLKNIFHSNSSLNPSEYFDNREFIDSFSVKPYNSRAPRTTSNSRATFNSILATPSQTGKGALAPPGSRIKPIFLYAN